MAIPETLIEDSNHHTFPSAALRPMAPARALARRPQNDSNINSTSRPSASDNDTNAAVNRELFLEPMMGTPLQMYIEKDVQDRDDLLDLITKHGGVVSPGYSGVPYILVDPHKESGQNLYRQYAGKKGKIVLNARWVHECIKAGALQTFQSNWAGCKVDGTEQVGSTDIPSTLSVPSQNHARSAPTRPAVQAPSVDPCQLQPQPPLLTHTPQIQPGIAAVEPLVHPQFPYQMYGPSLHTSPRALQQAATAAQSWQTPSGIGAPQPAQLIGRPPIAFREEPSWDSTYDNGVPPSSTLVGGPSAPAYEYRYREDQQPEWVGNEYYNHAYSQPYEHGDYIQDPATSSSSAPATISTEPPDRGRGRKRTRTQPAPAAPASVLVANRLQPPARSPTPPTRVVKSTYGGNLFTADDVLYLKKYIDYCQEQGLVLSLREICERIAVKAPHHTFYSWRRYCNKHQIRLGGYTMNTDRSPTPQIATERDPEDHDSALGAGPSIASIITPHQPSENEPMRNRSPTPPKALFRSTTGKGVAFTDEDVNFLVRFMEYRKSQGRLDMVAFWKDVASKAPHHSRASWMKFWRRHKHELNRSDGDDPLPQPPEKKMRYSREDDVLLARYFFNKPEGTSDKVFQAFGRLHPHHPWKGWQEHHRIHKAKIDHFIQQIANGENIDVSESPAE